jgi:hypothetical protein
MQGTIGETYGVGEQARLGLQEAIAFAGIGYAAVSS